MAAVKRGARFACPECDVADCEVHDTREKSWRHLDFFEHQAYLVARVPRVRCPEHGVRQVALPWARPGCGFSLLFEALVMALLLSWPSAVYLVVLLGGHLPPRLVEGVPGWSVVARFAPEVAIVIPQTGALPPGCVTVRPPSTRSPLELRCIAFFGFSDCKRNRRPRRRRAPCRR